MYPDNWTKVLTTGTFKTIQGAGLDGNLVSFTPTRSSLTDTLTQTIISADPIEALITDGVLTDLNGDPLMLPACDDPDILQKGWNYTAKITFQGKHAASFTYPVFLSVNMESYDLSMVVPDATASAGVVQILAGPPGAPGVITTVNGKSAASVNLVAADIPDVVDLDTAQTIPGVKTIPVRDSGGTVYNALAFGVTGDGTTDDLAAIQALVNRVLGRTGSESLPVAGAVAKGSIYFPPGSYKLSGKVKVYGAIGLRIYGAGMGATIFKVSSSTGIPYAFDFNGLAYSTIEDFSIQGVSTADIVTTGLGLNWSSSVTSRSCTQVKISRVEVRNITYTYGIGIGESSSSVQVDQVSMWHCNVVGAWAAGNTTTYQRGISIGGGTFGNQVNQNSYHCSSTANRYNYYFDATTSASVRGGAVGAGDTDFFIRSSGYTSIKSVRSENSGRFLDTVSGVSFGTAIDVEGILFNTTDALVAADKAIFKLQQSGVLSIKGCFIGYGSFTSAPQIFVGVSSNRPTLVKTEGFISLATVSGLVVPASTASAVAVEHTHHIQLNSGGQPTVTTPSWRSTMGTAPLAGTTQNPPAYQAAASVTTDLVQWKDSSGNVTGGVGYDGSGKFSRLVLPNGNSLYGGTGAPTFSALAGDYYFRADTPTNAQQQIYVCQGTNVWASIGSSATPATDSQRLTSNGTWAKPAGARSHYVAVTAPGAGGGSGARGASGTALSGGGGGGGGAYAFTTLESSLITATVSIVVPIGGLGGAPVTTDNTPGNPGAQPLGATNFGSYLVANRPGGGGGGGLASAGAAGATANGSLLSGAGGAGSATGAAGANSVSAAGLPGGGGGGGITTAGVASAGGIGAASTGNPSTAGAAGAVNGNGGNGTSSIASTQMGAGGGGGGASVTGSGGSGGSGGPFGTGGGGGGASLNGQPSGAGGNGAPGLCLVITYF